MYNRYVYIKFNKNLSTCKNIIKRRVEFRDSYRAINLTTFPNIKIFNFLNLYIINQNFGKL